MKSLNDASLFDVVYKLRNRERFGLYGRDRKCYFEDGVSADEKLLWEALKIIYASDAVRFNRLHELCPDNYLGQYDYSFKSCQIVRKVGQFFFGAAA